MKNKYTIIAVFGISILLLTSYCVSKMTIENNSSFEKELWPQRFNDIASSNVLGFGFLYRIPGQWNGPVTTDTPAGNFPAWYVDYRPTSFSQVSQFSTVDKGMSNYMSFFVVKHNGQLKVAQRTDAFFNGVGCITYEIMEKSDEKNGYYRFVDFQSGKKRAYTEYFFKDNSVEMKVYTNKFNRLNIVKLHSTWNAKRVTMKYAASAIKDLNYPQPKAMKDFTGIFGNIHESVFFDYSKDPYPSKNEPYVGSATFKISIDPKLKTKKDDELMIMLTTRPIFDGYNYLPERLGYISKLIYLPISMKKYTLTHLHPGEYYLYSYNDTNGDRHHKSGDYMAAKFEHKITILPRKDTAVATHINFIIP